MGHTDASHSVVLRRPVYQMESQRLQKQHKQGTGEAKRRIFLVACSKQSWALTSARPGNIGAVSMPGSGGRNFSLHSNSCYVAIILGNSQGT